MIEYFEYDEFFTFFICSKPSKNSFSLNFSFDSITFEFFAKEKNALYSDFIFLNDKVLGGLISEFVLKLWFSKIIKIPLFAFSILFSL